MNVENLYQELRSTAALESDRALIRIRSKYEPAGGTGARVYPPTYPTNREESPYVCETRMINGEKRDVVLLDSVPSQVNRAELALLRGLREQLFEIPLMVINHKGSVSIQITSLELPHRYADAYLRDSEIDGVKFDKTELGKSFLAASMDDATALFRHDPGSLVFGAWNSFRKGRQAKFSRCYSSEVIGYDPIAGVRKAGKMDPLNLVGKAVRDGEDWIFTSNEVNKKKGERLSEIGLGNIAPNSTHGGVTVTSAERIATLSFATLDRLGFGMKENGQSLAARTLLAAYVLLADRLAFSTPSLWLRSGCELVLIDEQLEWVCRGGGTETLTLTIDDAIDLYKYSCDQASNLGFSFSFDVVDLSPSKNLGAAIEFALTKAESSESDE